MSMPTDPRSCPAGRLRAILLGLPVTAVLLALSASVALAQDADKPVDTTEETEESPAEPVTFVETEAGVHAVAIYALAEQGSVQGCEEGQPSPTDPVTRG